MPDRYTVESRSVADTPLTELLMELLLAEESSQSPGEEQAEPQKKE